MVIQCSSCDTRFKIADDKVKAGGVKVRCSKCKEVFTVLPPEEEQVAATAAPSVEEPPAPEPSSGDWSDMNATFSEETSQESSEEPASGLDDVDWDSLNGEGQATTTDETDEPSAAISSDDFSFGDEEEETAAPESDDFSFGDEEEETAAPESDDFSFGDEESIADDTTEEADDEFSFGGETEDSDNLDTEEPVGEGAQDEFSFDEEPAATGGVDDFDWDGDSSAASGDDDNAFGFGEDSQSDDSLDFSSLEMSTEEEPSVEVEAPQVETPSPQEMTAAVDDARPATVKGPQKRGKKGHGARKGKKIKKQSGPLRGIITLLFLLCLVLGGGLFGLQQMGFWSGNFEELPDVDYATAGQAAWQKAVVQFNKLIGNQEAMQPVGSITITGMSGKYIENTGAGMLFVIEGNVRNDFTSNRSAIAVRGILYDAAGSPVQQQKVYCGNSLDNNTLRSETVAAIQARGANEFGDSLSNLDVAPGAALPFVIVFAKLPENLSEYNVEVAGSAASAKQ